MSDPRTSVDRPIDEGPASRAVQDVNLPAVLLVDDRPGRLLACETVLADLPVRCVRALSGEEALAQLLKVQFAAIILDVAMPGMDGFETARLIRAHHRFQKTPIVFLTGVHLTDLDRLKGYEVGAIDYLSLPIIPQVLRSKIAILVELYQRRCELEELTHVLVAARSHLDQSDAAQTADPLRQTTSTKLLAAEQYDELLRMVSHDLRTALAPMHYLLEMLLNQTAPTNPIRPALQMVQQYSLRISHLADDFDARASRYP